MTGEQVIDKHTGAHRQPQNTGITSPPIPIGQDYGDTRLYKQMGESHRLQNDIFVWMLKSIDIVADLIAIYVTFVVAEVGVLERKEEALSE